jgi:hypothetical protein
MPVAKPKKRKKEGEELASLKRMVLLDSVTTQHRSTDEEDKAILV